MKNKKLKYILFLLIISMLMNIFALAHPQSEGYSYNDINSGIGWEARYDPGHEVYIHFESYTTVMKYSYGFNISTYSFYKTAFEAAVAEWNSITFEGKKVCNISPTGNINNVTVLVDYITISDNWAVFLPTSATPIDDDHEHWNTATITINDYKINSFSADNKKAVLIHELGHAIGMEDNAGNGIMTQPHTTLVPNQGDIKGAAFISGSHTDHIYGYWYDNNFLKNYHFKRCTVCDADVDDMFPHNYNQNGGTKCVCGKTTPCTNGNHSGGYSSFEGYSVNDPKFATHHKAMCNGCGAAIDTPHTIKASSANSTQHSLYCDYSPLGGSGGSSTVRNCTYYSTSNNPIREDHYYGTNTKCQANGCSNTHQHNYVNGVCAVNGCEAADHTHSMPSPIVWDWFTEGGKYKHSITCVVSGCNYKFCNEVHTFYKSSTCIAGQPGNRCDFSHSCNTPDLTRWVYDETYHWNPCVIAGCDYELYNEAAHNFNGGICTVCGATQGGQGHQCDYNNGICTICGAPQGGQGHTHNLYWGQNDYKHWQYCVNCGYETEREDHDYVNGVCVACGRISHIHGNFIFATTGATTHSVICGTGCGQTLGTAPHIYGTGTSCTYHCGESHTHAEDTTKWEKSSTQHWCPCNNSQCSYIFPKSNHNFGVNTSCSSGCGQTHSHVASSTVWKKNTSQHWRPCNNSQCQYEFTKSNHSFGTWGNELLCTSGCGQANPNHYHEPNIPPVFQYNSTNHWVNCKISGCSQQFGLAPHSYTNNTKCSSCAYTHTHTTNSTWKYDVNSHWKDCQTANCDSKVSQGLHNYVGGVCSTCSQPPHTVHTATNPPTWTATASYHVMYCSMAGCGYQMSPLLSHTFSGNKCTVCGYQK